MTNRNDWHQQNDRYLAASLDWLRLKLNQRIIERQAEMPTAKSASPGWLDSLRGSAPRGIAPIAVSESELNRAATLREEAIGPDQPPALLALAERLHLSSFERDLLFVCAAPEFDPGIGALYAQLQGDSRLNHPTFALAMSLLRDNPERSWDARTAARPLRYWYLLEMNQPGVEWVSTSPLAADEYIVDYMNGVRQLDDRLAPFLATMQEHYLNRNALPESQQKVVQQIVTTVRNLLQTPDPAQARLPLLQLVGADAASKRTIAVSAASALGLDVYRITLDQLPTGATEVERFARLWQRSSTLLPLALYIDAAEAEPTPALSRMLARANGLFFLEVREVWTHLGEPTVIFDVQNPLPEEQQALWANVLGMTPTTELPARLAGCFDFDALRVRRLADQARRGERDIFSLCRQHARTRMEGLAQRIDTRATLRALVLPTEAKQQLLQLAAQARHRLTVYDEWGWRARMNRGLGISALFAGDSGTGKTMTAEAIASELELDLYRIDLSAVVSKYIGETEKNLRRVFDAAEQGGAVLFFDEADALFGKRSEVKDSHDRYANIEVNYLLQRMESFEGIAILATNLKQALDSAFLRRLRFVINFAYPGVEERKRIWQQEFPAAMRTNELDWARLAKFNLTGGNIHSVALNASFLAAAAGSPELSMDLVLRAVRDEYQKLDRTATEADFRV